MAADQDRGPDSGGERPLVDLVRAASLRLHGVRADYDPLLDRIDDARFVLIGDGTHGTHEFYRERAELTRRLILEKGFHAVAVEADWPDGEARERLRRRRLERAIGVLYLPETERVSHYFETSLPEQFDAVVHIDETRALEPLERTAAWHRGEVPETYPSTV